MRACAGAGHGLAAVTGVRRDRATWAAMVENMVARGAKANDREIKLILDYLGAHFGR